MGHAAMTREFGDPGLSEQVNQARVGVLVSRLRSKLRHHAADLSCINCLRGQGYQLGISLVLDNLAPRAVIPDPGRPRPMLQVIDAVCFMACRKRLGKQAVDL